MWSPREGTIPFGKVSGRNICAKVTHVKPIEDLCET